MATLTLYTAKAFIILDSAGERILAKYWDKDFSLLKDQIAFENSLFEKTKRAAGGEVVMFDGYVTVYRNNFDVFFYVVGSARENELLLSNVINIYCDALAVLLRNQVEKRAILENYDLVALALDELIDDGIVLECDSSQIASRVSLVGAESGQNAPFSEQSLSQALQSAKIFSRALLK